MCIRDSGALRRPFHGRPVVGDVGEVEALHQRPGTRVEDLAHAGFVRAGLIHAGLIHTVFAHVSEDRRMSLSVSPDLAEVLATLSVVQIPMRVRFRGVTVREVAVVHGPKGWGEFSPFPEYDDAEASRWLSAAIEAGCCLLYTSDAADDLTRVDLGG